jgi:hypothetical protein
MENKKTSIPSSSWLRPEYWRQLIPDLHCSCDDVANALADSPQPVHHTASKLRCELTREGSAVMTGDETTKELAFKLVQAGDTLALHGIPMLLLLAYDEAWILMHRHQQLLCAALKGTKMNYDCYAWRISPGGRGWHAHRDRASCSAFSDGAPHYATTWIALTNVTVDTACMFTVSPDIERKLSDHDEQNCDDPNTLEQRYSPVARALEISAGAAAVWGGRTLHWGGPHFGTPDAPPRCSLAFAVSSPDLVDDSERIQAMEAWSTTGCSHLLRRVHDLPPLEARIKLCALQLEFYTDAQPLDANTQAILAGLDALWESTTQDVCVREKLVAEFMACPIEADTNQKSSCLARNAPRDQGPITRRETLAQTAASHLRVQSDDSLSEKESRRLFRRRVRKLPDESLPESYLSGKKQATVEPQLTAEPGQLGSINSALF